MIYDKRIASPSFRRRTVRRKLSLFRDESNSLSCTGLHFLEENGRLLCAEGAEEISSLPAGADNLLTSTGHMEKAFVSVSGTLISLDKGSSFQGASSPGELIFYRAEDGSDLLFQITEEGIFLLNEFGAEKIANAPGGTCGCIVTERMITAFGYTVSWSKPLSSQTWSENLDEGGHIELVSKEGTILAMIPFLDKVYLFRENGINALKMSGDPLNISAEYLPVCCGQLQKNSVKLCGRKVVFLAEDGIYVFDGTKTKRLTGCGFSEIDLKAGVTAATFDGNYYAAVTLKSQEKAIWAIDPENERGHFIRAKAQMLAGGESIYYAEEGKLFRLIGRDVPLCGRRECSLQSEPSLLGLSPGRKYLDAVAVEGKGSFYIEAKSERGRPRAVFGKAGERLCFPAPVAGTSFSFHLRTDSEQAEIKSLIFELREETGSWT